MSLKNYFQKIYVLTERKNEILNKISIDKEVLIEGWAKER